MTGAAGARGRILLVEDNDTIRAAFAVLLEESGYEVVQAEDGAGAIEVARDALPHLILMDLGLPDASGLDVTRSLKSDPATAPIPVIAITGRALETDQAACMAAGCAGYLAKPVDTQQLLSAIPEYMGTRADRE